VSITGCTVTEYLYPARRQENIILNRVKAGKYAAQNVLKQISVAYRTEFTRFGS